MYLSLCLSVDKDRMFTHVLFAGYEGSLFMWNMSTFLLLYYLVPNPVLAAVVTYVLNLVRLPFAD
jgi:Meckelin (Transmembrane protein 67)